jgi:hypothetical protein
MDFTTPITQLVVLLFLGAISKTGFEFVKNYWKVAKPEEYMIVLRGGEMIMAGVGLKTFIYPGDTCITYPSRV